MIGVNVERKVKSLMFRKGIVMLVKITFISFGMKDDITAIIYI